MVQKLFLGFLVVFAIGHLFLTVIYLTPNNPIVSGTLQKVSKEYMNPIFSQRWGFFSPRPGVEDVEFEYTCINDFSKDERWINLEEKRLKQHQKNKFLGLGRVLYLSKGLAEELLRRYELDLKQCVQEIGSKVECTPKVKMNIITSKEFYFANRLFRNKCKADNYNGYQFRIRVTKPIQFSKKNTNPKREYAYLKFPKVPYKK